AAAKRGCSDRRDHPTARATQEAARGAGRSDRRLGVAAPRSPACTARRVDPKFRSAMHATQLSLLGREQPTLAPDFSRLRRPWLDDASFLDYLPEFVAGHAALFAELERAMRWHTERRVMYDRDVDVPRLLVSVPEDGTGHALLASAAQRLGQLYD